MEEGCSRNLVRLLALLLLAVWTLCTMTTGHILGSLGFEISFQNGDCHIISFNDKLINCIKFFLAALTISAFATSGITWSVLFIFSKLERFIRKCSPRIKTKELAPEALSEFAASVGDKDDSDGTIFQHDVQERDSGAVHLRQPCTGTLAAIFSATLLGSLSVTSSVLAVKLKSENIDDELLHYIVSDVSAGLFFPLLYLAAAVIMTVVMDYWTCHALKCHTLLAMMLPGVVFMEAGDKGGYWVFSDTLTVGKNHDSDLKNQDHVQSVTPEPYKRRLDSNYTFIYSSILLAVLFILNKTLSFSYFVDISFIFQTTLTESCLGSKYMWYNCFDSDTFRYVNCLSPGVANVTLYCYRFNTNFQDANIILAILSSCGLHIGLLCVLADLIFVVGKLQKFFRHLGSVVAVMGVVLLSVTISMFVVRQISTSNTAKFLHSYFNVLHFVQLAILCVDVIVIGLLVRKGRLKKSDVLEGDGKLKETLETLV